MFETEEEALRAAIADWGEAEVLAVKLATLMAIEEDETAIADLTEKIAVCLFAVRMEEAGLTAFETGRVQ
jgi:hypothetical protein